MQLDRATLQDGCMILLGKSAAANDEYEWQAMVWDGTLDSYGDRHDLASQSPALYQWSAIGRDNQLVAARSRELVIPSLDLLVDDNLELYVALVDNSAAIDETFAIAEEEEQSSSSFRAKKYDLSLRFESMTEPSLCPNQCSNNGQCQLKEKGSRSMPYCSCFEGFIGADCGLAAKAIELDEAE